MRANTILLGAFMGSSIFYTINKATPLSIEGLFMLGMMLLFICWKVINGASFSRSNIALTLICILYFSIHLIFTDTRIENVALNISSIIFFIVLQKTKINKQKIAAGLLLFWITNILFYLNSFINSFQGTAVKEYFSGFFQNSNTFAAYSAIVLASTLLFFKNNKVKIFVIILFIITLFAHHSRNTLLFTLSSGVFYFLFIKGKAKASIILFSIIILGSFFYIIVIEPNSQIINFTMFGKKADTAGRSEQVLAIIQHFDLSWFGVGGDIIAKYSQETNEYSLHNAWVNTIYSMGIVYVMLYAKFIQKIFIRLTSLAKSILLGFHIYFFFEPGLFFSILLISSFPLIVIILSLNHHE